MPKAMESWGELISTKVPLDVNLSAVRSVQADQHVHQGTFTGPVLTKQGKNFALMQGQTNLVVGKNPGKVFCYVDHTHDRRFVGVYFTHVLSVYNARKWAVLG